MSEPTALEQYMLELINAERAKAGVQPLAFDGDLNESSELHSQWMINTDSFSHTGSGGSSPTQRMQAAGYSFNGSWASGENIAMASLRGAPGYDDEVLLLHNNLMNSAGHRANILNANYREIGVGFEVGQYGSYQSAFVTENFARSGTSLFATGVAYKDADKDGFYDPGEGLGGVTVTAVSASGAKYVTTTMAAGGYDLALSAGTYTLTFSGGGVADTSRQVTIGSQNVKVDLVNPAAGGGTAPTPTPTPNPTPGPIVGTNAGQTLQGTSAADLIQGLGGADRLYGAAGNDTLEGGTGNDYLYGGAGADVLTGGSGYDSFVFDTALGGGIDRITDFSRTYDTIRLENAVFTALTSTGTLSSGAFVRGAAARDSTDRIIYNPATGAVMYDADGSGAAPAVTFAQLAPNLQLTNSDFVVF